MTTLEAVYDIEDVSELGEEQKKEFVITDDLRADWAIKIIKQEEAQAARLTQTIDQEIEILMAKKKQIIDNANCGFLKGKLADYFESLSDESKKTSKTQISYKLPSGSLVFKPESTEYVKDEAKILDYLTNNNRFEFIKTNPKVDWANLKVLGEEELSKIEGITIQTKPASFNVK